MENTFKQIVLIQIILLPVLIVLDIFFAVPEDITNLPYFEGAVADMSDSALIISLIVALVLLIAHYVSCFLIYFFKSAGRPIYLWTIILIVASALLTPHVMTGLFATVDTASSILAGLTIAFMYYTPLKEKFEK